MCIQARTYIYYYFGLFNLIVHVDNKAEKKDPGDLLAALEGSSYVSVHLLVCIYFHTKDMSSCL
jgi:hypothetical protein